MLLLFISISEMWLRSILWIIEIFRVILLYVTSIIWILGCWIIGLIIYKFSPILIKLIIFGIDRLLEGVEKGCFIFDKLLLVADFRCLIALWMVCFFFILHRLFLMCNLRQLNLYLFGELFGPNRGGVLIWLWMTLIMRYFLELVKM
jgi:hypothetical protein